ncbi:helix-turn-helix domain-containing protein [Streptomyces sp. 549]|uniref:TetR/AcrR family transcriptional regulator n=1 Tax=Streptomyces sp. 549 TaxID=3049076 RepID=UPI0024C3F559|nr:helix-turn-helix domain-containing protein [Streptomyces sp. 549]MDK1476859.1 helix-turn-helix domain-containing protein [Streptomyces sp. 549]
MTNGVRAQQRVQTRHTLLRESRRLFSTFGYAAVGLSEIVRAAGVTKGALYHHFDSKAELFRAVLEQVQQEVAAHIAATADAQEGAWDQLTFGCQAFLNASTDPAIQRIMLVDGPAVLGWRDWREMNEATCGRHLARALTILVDEGTIPTQPVAPLTHLLSGAMNEAALWLATSEDLVDLENAQRALARMLEALRAR